MNSMNIKEILEDYITDVEHLIQLHSDMDDEEFVKYYTDYSQKIKNYLEYIKCREDFDYFKDNYILYNNGNRNK